MEGTLIMVKQPADSGIYAAIKKVPPHFVFGAMFFALLWLMQEYFVSRKEYEKDQHNIHSTLTEMRMDIKELLRK
jgi:hypothetical protein